MKRSTLAFSSAVILGVLGCADWASAGGESGQTAAAPAGPCAPETVNVEALVESAIAAEPAEGRRLVRTIQLLGGLEAARGLVDVAKRAPHETAPAAFCALGRLGLREERVLEHVRSVAERAMRVKEQAAALTALGRLGDAQDVPFLIETLDVDDGALRSAAFQALRRLSGERLPASPRRIRGWWKRHVRSHEEKLHGALRDLPEAIAAEQDLTALRVAIAKHGWLDIEAVTVAVRDWLGVSTKALDAEAYRVIAELRLADFAPVIRRALERRRAPCSALARAVRVLGL